MSSGLPYLTASIMNGFRAFHVIGPDDSTSRDYLIGQMVSKFANHPQNPYHCASGYTAPSRRFGALASEVSANWPDIDINRIARNAANFKGKVLLLAGNCNEWIGENAQRRHLAHFNNPQLRVIGAAGHDAIWDSPDETLNAIRGLLLASSHP